MDPSRPSLRTILDIDESDRPRMKPSITLLLWLLLGLAVVAAGALALAPSAAINAWAAIGSHRVQHSVPYGALPRQRLDVYAPRRTAPAGGYPLVVFFYGGSWNRGERADYRFVGEALAARGVLTLVADYRLYPEVRYPDFLADCALALAHGLREGVRLGGNPRRSFVIMPRLLLPP